MGLDVRTPLDTLRLRRDVFSVGTLADDEMEQQLYWKDRSADERLEAVELMRQMIYDYNPLTDRLQRVLTVTELGED